VEKMLMQPYFPNHPSLTYVARFGLLALVFAGTAWMSLTFIPAGASGASLVWPVSAIGLAGLLFWGLDLWPALLLGIFAVLLSKGYAPPLAAGVSLGNSIEALIGVYILMRAGFHPIMSRLRDTLGLILASFTATFASALVIAGSAALFYTPAFNSELLVGLWIGHTVSLLSFAPFVLRWGYRPLFRKTWREALEGLSVFGIIFILTFLLFWTPHGSIGGISLVYILLLPLIWVSLRTGPRGIALALFLIATVGISGILWGYGPVTAHAAQALFAIQTLIGALSLIFLLFTSLTEERKEAVIALEGHVDQLEDALEKISGEDRAKSEFIAILAHELRNPLSPVLSGLEILKTHEQGPLDVHHMMGTHLNTLARLLDDLLDITRISQNKFTLKQEAVTLQDTLERSFEMAGPYLASRKHALTRDIPVEDIWVDADPVRLSQVFVNLLNNAAKYTPPGGAISLTARREGREAVVRVRDSGQGIAASRLKAIFEPFAGGGQRQEGPGGLHVGLSLAKRMTELHQGTLEARSGGVGEGSEFIVRLPLPAASSPLVPPAKKEERGRFSKEAMETLAREVGEIGVLVVDDNEAAAQMLATLLTHNGHRVSIAHTGFAALEEAAKSRPHVALLDIGLPDISGYEVGRRLRAQFGQDIALVALTGYGQEEDRQKATDAGFDDHLVKPVSIVDVERTLAKLKRA
jgi:signal transduction histidine kinase/CheY-like chemotaxis protein